MKVVCAVKDGETIRLKTYECTISNTWDKVVSYTPDLPSIPLYTDEVDSMNFTLMSVELRRIAQQYRLGRTVFFDGSVMLKAGKKIDLYMDVMPKIDSVDFSRHKMYVETPSDTLHIVLNDYDSYTGNWHNNECFVEFSTLNVVKNGIKLMATQLEFFYIMEVYRDAGVHLSGVYNETTRIRFRLNTAWKGYSMFLCVDDFNIFQVGNNKVGDTLNYVTQGWTPVIEINVNGGFVLNK